MNSVTINFCLAVMYAVRECNHYWGGPSSLVLLIHNLRNFVLLSLYTHVISVISKAKEQYESSLAVANDCLLGGLTQLTNGSV